MEDKYFVTIDNISEDGAGLHSEYGGFKLGDKLTMLMEMPPKPGGPSKATLMRATVTIVYVVAEAKTGQFRIGLKIVEMNESVHVIFRKLLG